MAFRLAPGLQGRAKPAARQNVNSRSETESWFTDAVFRFAANELVEVSFKTPERLQIDDQTMISSELLHFMRERDPELFEALDFR